VLPVGGRISIIARAPGRKPGDWELESLRASHSERALNLQRAPLQAVEKAFAADV